MLAFMVAAVLIKSASWGSMGEQAYIILKNEKLWQLVVAVRGKVSFPDMESTWEGYISRIYG